MSSQLAELALAEYDRIIKPLREQLDQIDDVKKQLDDSALIINNFVLQALGPVQNMPPEEAVRFLTDSMVRIKDFANERSRVVLETKQKVEDRLGTVETCKKIIETLDEALVEEETRDSDGLDDEMDMYTDEDEIIEDEVVTFVDPEPVLRRSTGEKKLSKTASEAAKRRKKRPARLDKPQRVPGTRPERLKTIRERQAQNIPEEDI